MSGVKRLIHEVHRRSLWQVLAIYVGLSWIVLQVVDVVGNNFGLPEWVPPFALILLLIGLPIVMATAFVQEGVGPSKRVETGRPDAGEPAGHLEPEPSLDGYGVDSDQQPLRRLSTPGPAGAHHRLFTWRNALLGGAAAFGLLGLATAGYLAMRAFGIGPAGTLVAKGVLEERARVLVADFGGSNPELARSASAALRVDFGQSRVVQLVSRSDVSDALQRMDRDRDSELDAALAREVAIRDGIPAVVAGDVSSAGGGYLLSAELIEAESGEVLISARETARDSTGLLDAVDELSKKLRERIGESLRILGTEQPLERVTTPSLAALRKYSQALHTIDVLGDDDRGIALLEEAIELDSAFAMAYRRIGAILGNRAQERAKMVEALSSAFRHRDRLTEKERYHAEALYYFNVTGEIERSSNAYRNLVDLDPLDAYALNNLGVVYSFLRDFDRAREFYERAIGADSSNSLSYSNAAQERFKQGRIDEAHAMLDLFAERFPGHPSVLEFEALFASAEGDYEAAERLVRRRRDEFAGNAFFRWQTSWDLWALAVTHGKLAEARGHIDDAMDAQAARGLPAEILNDAVSLALADLAASGNRDRALAAIADALDRSPLEELLPLDRPYPQLATAYAKAGDLDRARRLLAEYDELVPEELRDWLLGLIYDGARGEIALAEGRTEDALDAFERADIGFCTICRLPGRARALEALGQADSAATLYARYIETPWPWRLRFNDPIERAWILERLGQLNDAAGDLEKAARYYSMFVDLWSEADEELQPRVRDAQARLEEIVRQRG